MAATESNFTNIDTDGVGAYLGDQWPGLAAAVQSLTLYFLAKVAEGAEPTDVLSGIMFGLGGQSTNHKDWRLRADSGGDFLVQENTGTDASPVWATRLTIGAGGFTVPAHAGRHQHGGADEVATSTPAANAIVKAEGDGKINGGWISPTDIDHGGLSGKADDDHTQYARADGTRAITGSQQFDVNVKTDTIVEKTAAAGVTIDSVLLKDGTAVNHARLDVAEEFTKAKGSTESTPSSSSGSITIDFDASNYFEITLTENITSMTISNTTRPGTRVIKFKQDATGGRTVAWDADVKWPGGTAPVITATANAVDVVSIVVDSAGTMYGAFSQDFS